MTPATWRPFITRGALLLMESLWVYALVAFLVAAIAPGGKPTLPGVIALVLVSYGISRLLQSTDLSLGVVRVWGIVLSLILFYTIVRIDFFGDLRLWDFSWIDGVFNDTERVLNSRLDATFGLPLLWLVWLRGVMRGQQRLAFEDVLASFGIGILVVAFVEVFQGAADTPRMVSLTPVPFIAIGLMAMALAHAARSDDEFARSFGPTWLVAVGGAVLALGLVALIFVLLDFTTMVDLLSAAGLAVGHYLGLAIYYVTWPVIWLIEHGLDIFGSVFRRVWGAQRPNTPINQPDATPGPENNEATKHLPAWAQFLVKLLVVGPLTAALLVGLALVFTRYRRRPPIGALKESTYEEGRLGADLGDFFGSLLGRLRPNLHLGRDNVDAVRRLYYEVVEEGATKGVERRPPETPLELSPRLDVATASPAPTRITRAFNDVRYGAAPPSDADVLALRREWESRTK